METGKKDETKVVTDMELFEGRKDISPVVPVVATNDFISTIERLSAMPDIPVEKIQQLFEMKQAEDNRLAQREFNAAMMRTQGRIELVVAGQENKQTGSNYANLKAILIKTKPIYTAEGFSLMFYEGESPKETQKRVCVDIMHSGGHTEKRYGDFTIQTTGIAGKAMMTQIHGEGSAFSYGRRYLTCMIFNIPTGDDDDGNAAGGKQGGKDSEKYDAWVINCDECAENGIDVLKEWWNKNSKQIKKDCGDADAAKIYKQMTTHIQRLKKDTENDSA